MLWGAGTAIGEVPPYYISYQTAVAEQKHSEEASSTASHGTTDADVAHDSEREEGSDQVCDVGVGWIWLTLVLIQTWQMTAIEREGSDRIR